MSQTQAPESKADLIALLDESRSTRVEVVFGVEPTAYQATLLDYADAKERAQTAPKKGRQVGATFTAGMLGADHALTHADTDVLYTAPSQGTANEMFRECKKLFWNADMSLDQFGVAEDNKETWEFNNGTRILSRTLGNVEQSNNSGNRGMNPTCVIVDEADYTNDRVYEDEIEPFFTTHPEYEFHLFSTPADPTGYFHDKVEVQGRREASDAQDAFSWFAPHWPTTISPFAQEDFIQNRKDKLPASQFDKEFRGEFPEAGGNAIPKSTLMPCIRQEATFNPDAERYLAVDPARSGSDQLVAADIDATGVYWNIWTYDTITGPELLGFLNAVQQHDEYPEPEVGHGETPADGYATILIEENGVGGFAADFADYDLGDVVKVVTSSNQTKQDLYQRFITDLEAKALTLPHHPRLIEQVTQLQKNLTPNGRAKYEHPKGGHDDWPDALAFADYARHGGGEQLEQEKTVKRRKARVNMNKRRS
jgi:hypothetical protein